MGHLTTHTECRSTFYQASYDYDTMFLLMVLKALGFPALLFIVQMKPGIDRLAYQISICLFVHIVSCEVKSSSYP